MYMGCIIMIPKAFLFTARTINYFSSPRSFMENSSLKAHLMPLNPTVEPLVMRNSSTYKTIYGKEPPFYFI